MFGLPFELPPLVNFFLVPVLSFLYRFCLFSPYLSVRLSPSSCQSFLSAFSLSLSLQVSSVRLFLRLSLLFASVRLLVRLSLFLPVFGVCVSLSVSLPVFVRQVFSVRLFPGPSSVRQCLLVRLSLSIPLPVSLNLPPPPHTVSPCIPLKKKASQKCAVCYKKAAKIYSVYFVSCIFMFPSSFTSSTPCVWFYFLSFH